MNITQLDTAMTMWPPNTRHYVADDGQHYAVRADPSVPSTFQSAVDQTLADLGQPSVSSGEHTIIACPTTIVACNADGIPADLTPLYIYPAGTTCEQALAAAGFEITSDSGT